MITTSYHVPILQDVPHRPQRACSGAMRPGPPAPVRAQAHADGDMHQGLQARALRRGGPGGWEQKPALRACPSGPGPAESDRVCRDPSGQEGRGTQAFGSCPGVLRSLSWEGTWASRAALWGFKEGEAPRGTGCWLLWGGDLHQASAQSSCSPRWRDLSSLHPLCQFCASSRGPRSLPPC